MIDGTFATIGSLLPFTLYESKPGLFPNEFIINRAPSKTSIGLSIIPNKVHYLVNPDILADAKDVRNIKVPVPAMELAQSIITDFSNGMLGIEMPDAMPGLLAVPGNYMNVAEFVIVHKSLIDETRQIQNRWFRNLIDIADDIWSKIKSPLAINDLQRYACESLELEREWQRPDLPELMTKCPYCQNVINSGAVKCLSCGEVIDKVKYQQLIGGQQNAISAK